MDQPTAPTAPPYPDALVAAAAFRPAANAPWYRSSRFWLTTAFKIFCALTASGAIPGTPESVKIVALVSALFSLLGYTASRAAGEAASKAAPMVAILLLWSSIASADVIGPKRIGTSTVNNAVLMALGAAAVLVIFCSLVAFMSRNPMHPSARRREIFVILLGSLAVGGVALADGPTAAPYSPLVVPGIVAPAITAPPPVALDPTIPRVPPDPAEKLVKLQTGLLALDAALHSTAAILGVPAISPAVPVKFWDTPTGHAVAVVFAIGSLVVPLSIAGIGAYQAFK